MFQQQKGRWDHPHAYGDKLPTNTTRILLLGSSPRVWGQGTCLTANGHITRIIPTRMGTRVCRFHLQHEYKDHPHAYGDKSSFIEKIVTTMGSSPRVWGQVSFCRGRTVRYRIIPTRMGTSVLKTLLAKVLWDHPHAYGDKAAVFFRDDVLGGSSPRVWGQASLGYRVGLKLRDHPHAYGDKGFSIQI